MSIIKYFLLLSIISGTVPRKKMHYNLKHATYFFQSFVEKYNKSYRTNREYRRRFHAFVENVKHINKINRDSSTVEFGITEFTDLTAAETVKKLSGLKKVNLKDRCNAERKIIFSGNCPDEWDWRDHNAVTPVRHQSNCGSCWAHATTGVIEGQYAILHNNLVTLSDQQIIDCSGKYNGCDGGFPHQAIVAATEHQGVASFEDYPFEAHKGDCRADDVKKVAEVLKLYNYHYQNINETILKSIIYHRGPTVIGMHAGIYFLYYEKGIAVSEDFNCFPDDNISHAALVVGYGTEKGIPYWILKNSYGRDWGERGYFRMKRNDNTCNITDYIIGVKVKGPS